MYKPLVIENRKIDVRRHHECTKETEIPLRCVDTFGIYRYSYKNDI